VAAWLARLRQRPFRILHIAWASVILLVCALLIATSFQGGHPPPMAFVPHALAAGILGHLLLLVLGWLAKRGRARVEATTGAAPWPVELTIIALPVLAASLFATVYTVDSWGSIHTRPLEWSMMAAIAATHVSALVLLLLRRSAARWLLAAISLGWAIGMGRELHTARGPGEWVIGIALVAGLLALAIYLARSARVRAALR
jgi:hypothetical protein